MIVFTDKDRQMLNHVVDVVGDRMRHEDGYTDQDGATLGKLDQLAKTEGTQLVVDTVTPDTEALALLREIVSAELRHWVPGASQRLIYRASTMLGFSAVLPKSDDHGPDPADHALFPNWVGGLFTQQCATCARIFRAAPEQR
jgi:hypothetical protein